MTYATYVREGGAPYVRPRRRRRPLLKGLLVALALSGGAMSGFWMLGQGAPTPDAGNTLSATARKAPAARLAQQQAPAYSGLLDPALSGGKGASFVQGAPVRAAFQPAIQPPSSSLAAAAPAESALPLPPQPPVTLAEKAAPMPMPVPRPLDLLPKAEPQQLQPQQLQPRVAQPTAPRRNRTAAAAAPTPEDNRNFFDKLFGVQKQAEPAGTALA